MYPVAWEVNLHAVDVVHSLVCVALLNSREHLVNIDCRGELNLVLRCEVCRVAQAQLCHCAVHLSEVGQEECYAYQCIATIVQLRVDNSTVTLATDYCAGLLHLGHYVHLAYSRSRVLTTVSNGYIAQSTRRREVRAGVTQVVREDIVGNSHQGILLAKHRSILVYKCQAVNVWVNHDTEVCTHLYDNLRDLGEVLSEWLRVVCKLAVRLAVELHNLATELLQECGDYNTANRVYGVHYNLELACLNLLNINELECKHLVDVCRVEVLARNHLSDIVNIREDEVLLLGQSEHQLTLLSIEELTLLVEELERIPLLRVVRCGDDDTTVSLVCDNCHLGTRCGAETYIDYIHATTEECTLDDVVHHLARDTCVATYDDTQLLGLILACNKASVGDSKLNDVDWSEVFTHLSANCTADS